MPSKSPKLKLNVNNADRMRQYRKKWNEEQKQSNREKSRLRMREYRKRKKEEQLICAREKNVKTRQEVKKDEERKRKQAEYRRTYRQNLSGQKKRRIREKDALRKKLKRAEQKKTEKVRKGKEDPRPNYFQSNQSQSDTPIKPHEYTPSAVGKAVYRARKKLPKSPRKFAAVMKGLLQKVSPRKKAALKENGTLDNGSGDNLICEVLKEADASLKGKTKQERIQRKLFLRPIVKNIKKKYTIRKLSEKLGIRRRYLSSGCLKEERTRKDKLDKRTEERVSSFFQKEDISISLPNRKLVTKDGNERRILSGTLKETYDEWKEENPDMKLSLDKFIKLKPKSVKTQNNRKFLQCLCEYCENVTLKIRELNKFAEKCKKQDSKLKNIQDALDRTLCNKTGKFHALSCIDRNCSHCGTTKLKDDLKSNLPEADLTWKKWSMKASINTKTGKEIKKKQLTTQSGKTADLVDELINELDFLSKHLFEAHWQISQFAELKSNLPTNAVAVVADFAENYLCQSQNEIQAAHWAKDSITIHPTIVFYRCEDCSCIIEEACDVISNDLVHDSHAVFVFLEKIFQFLKEKRGLKIERVFLMTDGCAAQYKSRYPFADAANAVNDFNFVLQRDYYGSRHGKSRCDGEGGVLKSRVTRAVRNNEAVIGDAESFFKFCQEKMQKQQASNEKCEHKRRHMFYVDTTEVRRPRPERNIQTVNGTQKIHSLMGVSPTLIKTRRLSCFCDGCLEERSNECDNREYVDTWKTVHLKYVQSGQCKESVADNTDTPVSDENGLDKNDGISHSLESTITDTDKMSRGGYFRKLLVSLLGCTSFKDLSVICESEDIFLKDMFPLHIKHEQRTILSVKKEIDQMAFDLMPADIQYDHPIFPVKVFGDGNCLPRTGSLFAFGDEESHEEIRARIVVQSVKYAEKYLDSTILSAGTEEEHCLPKIYAQYSDFYIPGISLTDDIVRKVFENEILAICKRGSFMGIWQLHALADVLQCTIHSVHPQYGGYNTRKHLNRTILPSCEGNRGMDLHIMWSNVNGKDTKEVLWAPNHFVPLLPVDKIPSALEVETADEGDDSTLNSFSFTSNFSFDESIFNLVVDDEDAAPLVNWKEDNVVTPVAVDKAVPLTPSLDRRENDVTEIGAPTVVDLDLPLAPRSKQKKDNLTVVGVPDVDMGVAFVPRGDKKKNDLSVISAPTDVETDVHVDQKNLAVVGTPQDVKMVVPLAPCGDQKKHDLPVSGIPTNIDIEVPAVSSRDQTKDELLVVCPPDEPSTISQRSMNGHGSNFSKRATTSG